MMQTKNNKGFSLVELLVVIAVLAILTGIVGMSLNIIGRSTAKSAAYSVNDLLTRCKAENLSGMECYVELHDSYAALCASDGSEIDRSAFKKPVTIETVDNGITQIGFNMSTGALNCNCTEITVTYGRTSYVIELEVLTGRHSIQ